MKYHQFQRKSTGIINNINNHSLSLFNTWTFKQQFTEVNYINDLQGIDNHELIVKYIYISYVRGAVTELVKGICADALWISKYIRGSGVDRILLWGVCF